jgi:hypothetical protein
MRIAGPVSAKEDTIPSSTSAASLEIRNSTCTTGTGTGDLGQDRTEFAGYMYSLYVCIYVVHSHTITGSGQANQYV